MCPRAAGAGLRVAADKSTDLRDSKGGALLSSPAAFTVPGEQRPPPAGGRDLPLPRHQGRRAPSCAPARCAAPRAPQAAPPLLRPAPHLRRTSAPPAPPAPPLASAPRAPHGGGEGPRRPHPGQPLCPPGRGPRTGPHAEAASARGRPGSRLSAPRHSRRLRPLYLTSNRTVARPDAARGAGPGVPGGDCLPPGGARALAGGKTERPPRPPPAPPLRGGRPRHPPIRTLGEEASPIRSPLRLRGPAP